MWRSLFLALGIILCIVGAECLVMEKVMFRADNVPVAKSAAAYFGDPLPVTREFVPPEHAPWTCMSFGAVVILYSYSIPRRNGG
ncbi:MAG: hypothetical protein ACYC3X_00805 [Pirellulaceae bacterium]